MSLEISTSSPTSRQVSGLTLSQAQIWIGQQLARQAPVYNTPFLFRIAGEICTGRFREAFDRAVRNCDSLRRTFHDTPDGVQSREGQGPELEILDYSDHEEPFAEARLALQARCQRSFSLDRCLVDSALVRLGPEDFLWFVNQHHLVTDAQATALFFQQVEQCYRDLAKDQSTAAPPSFAAWILAENEQRERLSRETEDHWRQRVTVPALLYGRENATGSSASTRLEIDLGTARTEAIRELASSPELRSFSPDLSAFNLFAAVAFAYLRRVTGERRVTFGSPASQRSTAALRETVGLMVELFPLALELPERATWLDLLNLTQSESFGFLRNARPGAGEATGRSFHFVLNYITASVSTFDGHPVDVEWLHPGHCDPSHHLRIQVHDFGNAGSLRLIFDMNDEVVPESQRAWVKHHFLALIDAFLADRTGCIEDVALLHPEEEEWLLGSDPLVEAPEGHLVDALAHVVERQPESPALADETEALTYRDLDVRSSRLAGALVGRGVSKGDIVALRADRSAASIVGLLGILKAGASYLPFDPEHPADRLSLILDEAGVEVSVGDPSILEWQGVVVDPALRSSDDPAGLDVLPAIAQSLSGSDVAYVLYTSGSTGRPKGVRVEHRNVLLLVEGLRQRIYSTEVERGRVALLAPLVFDASVQQVFAALLLGHELVMVPAEVRRSGSDLLDFFHRRQIDVADGTPAHISLLEKASSAQQDPRVSHFVIGGEALRPSVVQGFYDRYPASQCRITNVYGPTECCVDSTSFTLTREVAQTLGKSTPIGRAMPGERVYVMAGSALQPLGAPGELCISGGGVSRGYVRATEPREGRREPFGEDPFRSGQRMYRTGDLVRLQRSGEIEFIGRQDAQVKVRGYRIELGEVESALRSYTAPARDPLQVIADRPVLADVRRCVRCVLSENYPGISFDDAGVCNVCSDFERYRPLADEYFRPFIELEEELRQTDPDAEYDCMLLYSGGKDSSYVLHRLVEMGQRVLAYTFDNGFISASAFRNIERQTKALGVESIISKTPRMDAIFVESLLNDQTVCSGCFRALTTISTRLAADRGITKVLTGLSRGQIYETKIDGLFRSGTTVVEEVESKLRDFRRIYHAQQDRTSRLLGESIEDVDLDQIHFIDFFRYDATPTAEVKAYLAERDSYWSEPKDTGFCSSNCMMNDIGICVHSKERGYHNYEAPLSWDVRLGIVDRADALEEVRSPVELGRINRVLGKIGYLEKTIDDVVVGVEATGVEGDGVLAAYFTSSHELDGSELRQHLASKLPAYMIPQRLVQVPQIPLTRNGKVDWSALRALSAERGNAEQPFVEPDGPVQEVVATVWSDSLRLERVGALDSFFSLGGTSLASVEVMAKLCDEFGLELPLTMLFDHSTVQELSRVIEEELLADFDEVEASS